MAERSDRARGVIYRVARPFAAGDDLRAGIADLQVVGGRPQAGDLSGCREAGSELPASTMNRAPQRGEPAPVHQAMGDGGGVMRAVTA